MARIKLGLFGSFFIVLIFVAACTNGITPTVESPFATETASVEFGPTAIPTQEDSGLRYINEEARISLILPEGWNVAGPFSISIMADGSHGFNLYNLGVKPEPSGGPGTSHLIVGDSQKLTIDDFVQYQCSTCPVHPIETVMLGDLPAKVTIIGGGSVPFEVEWYFFEHNGNLIGLSIHDPETLGTLEDVYQTLQLE
jgi:hypothetical protein